jgi:hypothetical protein
MKERVCPHTARIVRLKVLPEFLKIELGNAVGIIQAFMMHRRLMKRIVTAQKVARSWAVRRRLRRRREAAKVIQFHVSQRLLASPESRLRHKNAKKDIILMQAFARGFLERVKNKHLLEDLQQKKEDRRSSMKQEMESKPAEVEEAHPEEKVSDHVVV